MPRVNYSMLCQYKLATRLPGLSLTPASESDLERLCELLWHPEVRHFLCLGHILPRDTIRRMIASAGHSRGFWMIETESDGCVGYAGIEDVTVPPTVHPTIGSGVLLQIALHPRAWGRGFAKEAIDALTDHSINFCGLDRLLAGVYEPNGRGHRLMLRCRFSEVGRVAGPPKSVVYEKRSPTCDRPCAMQNWHARSAVARMKSGG